VVSEVDDELEDEASEPLDVLLEEPLELVVTGVELVVVEAVVTGVELVVVVLFAAALAASAGSRPETSWKKITPHRARNSATARAVACRRMRVTRRRRSAATLWTSGELISQDLEFRRNELVIGSLGGAGQSAVGRR
jgi:hypothetical protein